VIVALKLFPRDAFGIAKMHLATPPVWEPRPRSVFARMRAAQLTETPSSGRAVLLSVLMTGTRRLNALPWTGALGAAVTVPAARGGGPTVTT
jgi:hypothetical protein